MNKPLETFKDGDCRVDLFIDPDPFEPDNSDKPYIFQWDNYGRLNIRYAGKTINNEMIHGIGRMSKQEFIDYLRSPKDEDDPESELHKADWYFVPAKIYSAGSQSTYGVYDAACINDLDCLEGRGPNALFAYYAHERNHKPFFNDSLALLATASTWLEWASGEVYGYQCYYRDEEEDACWGLYGYSYAVDEAKDALNRMVNEYHVPPVLVPVTLKIAALAYQHPVTRKYYSDAEMRQEVRVDV